MGKLLPLVGFNVIDVRFTHLGHVAAKAKGACNDHRRVRPLGASLR
jgi:hypothetical protein